MRECYYINEIAYHENSLIYSVAIIKRHHEFKWHSIVKINGKQVFEGFTDKSLIKVKREIENRYEFSTDKWKRKYRRME